MVALPRNHLDLLDQLAQPPPVMAVAPHVYKDHEQYGRTYYLLMARPSLRDRILDAGLKVMFRKGYARSVGRCRQLACRGGRAGCSRRYGSLWEQSIASMDLRRLHRSAPDRYRFAKSPITVFADDRFAQ
jgi:hypothetical protein